MVGRIAARSALQGPAAADLKPLLPQPLLGPWVKDSPTVGTDWTRPVLEGWEPPAH